MGISEQVMRDAIASFGDAGDAVGVAEKLTAVGVFGLQDNYAAITVSGVAASAALDAVNVDNPVAEGIAGAAGVHVAREVNAQSQGLSVSMLIAVTPDMIVVYDWVRNGVTRLIHAFRRDAIELSSSKMGFSTRVVIKDTRDDFTLHLTGSTVFYSAVAEGDKHVLATLFPQHKK